MQQPVYPAGSHDSIQYHFFCGGKLFAMRIFRTDSLEHTSAWIFDGAASGVLSSQAKIQQKPVGHLVVSSTAMSLFAEESGGRIAVSADKAENSFEIEFTIGKTFRWGYDAHDAGEDVIHQPNLACVVGYRGRQLSGRGYCKRYFWKNPPRYWGYRFLQGFIGEPETSLWTADAMFGTSKYDYFKLLSQDGNLLEIPPDTCAHKQNLMFGYIDGVRHEARFEELGAWNEILRTPAMDSHIQQRYGKISYSDGKSVRTGVGITEYCFGTLG